jgi:hypothetical protein
MEQLSLNVQVPVEPVVAWDLLPLTIGYDIPSSDGVELEQLEFDMENNLREVWNG